MEYLEEATIRLDQGQKKVIVMAGDAKIVQTKMEDMVKAKWGDVNKEIDKITQGTDRAAKEVKEVLAEMKDKKPADPENMKMEMIWILPHGK